MGGGGGGEANGGGDGVSGEGYLKVSEMCSSNDASVSTFPVKSIELFSSSFWLLTRGRYLAR